MIDTETLSTTPRAALLQIGWAVFDPAGAGATHTLEVNVNVDSCMRLGGEVSDGTVKWWLDQSQEARDSVRRPGIDICIAISALCDDFKAHGCRQVWAHSPSFDCVIIEHYMTALGVTVPWRFWDLHDTRTLFSLASTVGWSRPRTPTAHSAVKDCLAQIRDVQAAWRHITSLASRPTTAQNPMDPSFRPGA
jgi:hypothetical protein